MKRGLVLALDAAWGGLGWALCHSQGPVKTGHVILSGRTWRMASLRDYLAELDHELADAQLGLAPDDPPLRVVIEEPPAVYSGASRGRSGLPIGNQAATGFGLGRIVGAIELWACRPDLGYPWLVNPAEWRAWWKVTGKGRAEKKEAALRLVRDSGWQLHTVAFPYKPKDDGGPRADVAEAILLGVGAAAREAEAPAGPRLAARAAPATVRSAARRPRSS